MIDLYFWTTPNGYKPLILLEECGLDYRISPVNISQGQQFEPAFAEISPNNKIPALVDQTPLGNHAPVHLFESGAILVYLAEKSGQFLPTRAGERADVLQWLFWQIGGLGPMLGQNLHFSEYAPTRIEYAVDRYANESRRLFRVIDNRLADRDYVAGSYSIADMAIYPWILKHEVLGIPITDFPNLQRWFLRIADRTAVRRSYELGATINTTPTVTEESKKILLGQSDTTVAAQPPGRDAHSSINLRAS